MRFSSRRQLVIEVFDVKLAFFATDSNLLLGDYPSVVIAEDGYEYFVSKPFFERLPVYIEIIRIPARRSILKDIPPILIVPAGNSHMIGHDVQHLTEMTFPETVAKPGMRVLTAEFSVYPVVVDDIVTMLASRRGLQIRRTVNVRYTELMQILRNRCSCGEVETGV